MQVFFLFIFFIDRIVKRRQSEFKPDLSLVAYINITIELVGACDCSLL